MKGKQEIKAILLGIGMGLLAMPSCSDDVINPDDRPENGAIMLQVGVSNSPAQQPLTRAAGDTYVALSPKTKFKLRVQGTWTGKNPELITKETTATAGAEQSFTAGKENPLTFKPVLFWDDYGTGDPANAETVRTEGLDILAVAVDGATTAMEISETEWKGTKSWTLQTDGTKTKVLTGDILVANNLSKGKTPGPLTFKNRDVPEKSRLIFQHLMSKITFNLKPADGFMQTGGKYAFTARPTVTLNRNRYEGGSLPDGGKYALVEGTISISDAKATPSENKQTVTAGDETKKEEGGAEVRTQVALVYPGTCLGENDNDVVARIAADNNYYYVTAKEIRAAIDAAGGHTDYKTLPGYNYIINVTVKKTGVNVTATVTNWVNVEAEEASPVIALTAGAGSTGETGDWTTTGVDGFDFFRSTAKLTGYSDETLLQEGDYYKPLRKVKWETTSGTTSPRACVFFDNTTGTTPTLLYWPDHDTHYHFRGVYPATTTDAASTAAPQVKAFTTAAGATEQGIAVQNGAFDQRKFPSNLMIGMPEIAKGSLCGSGEHTQVDMSENGICARSGKINMNFRYMMSQVEIELAHSLAEGAAGDVILNENTTVEIVGGYTEGYIRLGDRAAVGQKQNSYTTTVVAENKLKRHDIVLPQELADMKFKITVNNEGGTQDYYYATIKDIPVRVGGGASQSITKWEPGKHYKYTLKLKKTEMEITATLTDWITVTADEDIWM